MTFWMGRHGFDKPITSRAKCCVQRDTYSLLDLSFFCLKTIASVTQKAELNLSTAHRETHFDNSSIWQRMTKEKSAINTTSYFIRICNSIFFLIFELHKCWLEHERNELDTHNIYSKQSPCTIISFEWTKNMFVFLYCRLHVVVISFWFFYSSLSAHRIDSKIAWDSTNFQSAYEPNTCRYLFHTHILVYNSLQIGRVETRWNMLEITINRIKMNYFI